MPKKGYCSVADPGCTAPAGVGVGGSGFAECEPEIVTHCARCWEDVCTGCSFRMTLEGVRARYCHDCIGRALGEERLREMMGRRT